MDNRVIKLIVLYSCLSHGLVLRPASNDLANFYEVDAIKSYDESPIIHLLTDTTDNSKPSHVIFASKDIEDYKILLRNYILDMPKIKLLDIDAQVIINGLKKADNNKMVTWLNMYCEMHPDCDEDKLKEELRKVRPYL